MDHQSDLDEAIAEADRIADVTSELETITASPLSVFVDVHGLLDYFDGDEVRTFEFLGKLKDFFE